MSKPVRIARAAAIGILMVIGAVGVAKSWRGAEAQQVSQQQPAADPRASYETVTLARILGDTDALAGRGVWTSGILFAKGKDFFLKASNGDAASIGADLSIIGADVRVKAIENCQDGCPVKVAGMVSVHGGILVDSIKQN